MLPHQLTIGDLANVLDEGLLLGTVGLVPLKDVHKGNGDDAHSEGADGTQPEEAPAGRSTATRKYYYAQASAPKAAMRTVKHGDAGTFLSAPFS